MEYEIGKIVEFDGHCGRIISSQGEYFFTEDDIEDTAIAEGRYVVFRPEEIQGKQRAFFIHGAEQMLNQKQKVMDRRSSQ